MAGGFRVAIINGMAIAPLSRSTIPPDCRELTAADGFPIVDSARVLLRRNPRGTSPAVEGMAALLREAFAPLGALRPGGSAMGGDMTATLQTPFGPISLRDDGHADHRAGLAAGAGGRQRRCRPRACASWRSTLRGNRQVFDLPLDWGQGLHERVRRAMAGHSFRRDADLWRHRPGGRCAGAGGGSGLRRQPDPDPDPLPPGAGRQDAGRLFRAGRGRDQGGAFAP